MTNNIDFTLNFVSMGKLVYNYIINYSIYNYENHYMLSMMDNILRELVMNITEQL